jgi:hypothetical protein
VARARPEKPLTEAELIVLLRDRFAAPEYAFMPHVRNGTGYTRRTTRTADALAMSLWPSRGLDLHGFELKSSRADWLHEKDYPEKAEEIARFCDRWWLVVGREDIVQPGEVPTTWGLLVPRGGKLVVVKEPDKLDAKPLDRAQLAAILRKAAECVVPKAELDAERQRQVEQAGRLAEERLEQAVQSRTRHLENALDDLRTRVGEFEKASGVSIGARWESGRIGKAVKFVADGGLLNVQASMEGWRRRAHEIARVLDEQLADVPSDAARTEAEA